MIDSGQALGAYYALTGKTWWVTAHRYFTLAVGAARVKYLY